MQYNNLKKYTDLTQSDNSKQRVGIITKGKNKYIASTYIRLLSPFNHFKDDSFEFYIIDDLEIDKFREDIGKINENQYSFINNFKLDIIIVQRDAVDLELARLIVKASKLFGIKLIYEIDDDLINMDQTQPDYPRYAERIKSIRYLAEHASAISVTMDSLKRSLSGFNRNIEIIPNALTDDWKLNEKFKSNQDSNDLRDNEKPNEKSRADKDCIKIGYMGTTTHANDLKLIENAVKKIHNDYSDKNIIFEMVGGADNNMDGVKRINIPFDKRHYPDFVSWLQDTVDWDIAIAPLAKNNFINESKSELKYLEYTALNVVGIYSDVGPYGKSILNEENGLLVRSNTVDEWVVKMKKLIDDEALRKRIHQSAWKDVLKNYKPENIATNWEIFLNKNKRNKNSILYATIEKYLQEKSGISFNQFIKRESKTIIELSGLFDEDYYLKNYPDVRDCGLSPIDHYLKTGFMENCNPCEDFDNGEYMKKHAFVSEFNINPLVHHILYSDDFDYDYPIINCTEMDKNIEIIQESDLFDPELYLKMYPDVKNANVDPYTHFVNYGYKENFRNPFPNFSCFFYRNNYLNNSNTWNPLTHYILIGQNKGYSTNIYAMAGKHYEDSEINDIISHLEKKVSIILPIYNYSDIVLDSINKIISNTKDLFELEIFVSDENCEKYDSYFKSIASKTQINIHKTNNEFKENIGEFIKKASNDIVLLNSYTQVTDNWLNRLIIKAYSESGIDMVSPVSNFIADINPFEEDEESNLKNFTVEGISTLLKKSSNFKGVKSNIGDAYCIYIKNDTAKKINLKFSYDNYNKSMVVKIPKGTNHIIDDSTYVYHIKKFFLDNENIIKDKDCFDSRISINKFLKSPSIKNIRDRLDIAIADRKDVTLSNRILYVVDENKLELAEDFLYCHNKKHYDAYFLSCSKDYLKVTKDGKTIFINDINPQFDNEFRCDELRNIYFNLMTVLNINILQIDDLKYHSLDLFDLSNLLNIDCLVDTHMLDINDAFNENSILIRDRQDFNDINEYWHDELSGLLKESFILYPDDESLKSLNIGGGYKIVESPDIDKRLTDLFENRNSDIIRVLVADYLSEEELDLMREIKENDKGNKLELHFPNIELGKNLKTSSKDELGKNLKTSSKDKLGINHGILSKESLSQIIDEINPHCILLLKQSPEMFEVMNQAKLAKVPVIYNESTLKPFIDELQTDAFTDFTNPEESCSYILEFGKWENYYPFIKDLYYHDLKLKRELIMYDTELDSTYLKFGNNYPKHVVREEHLSERNNAKKVPFSDFEGFLANSYVSPILYAPFAEEEKRCFAVMDNITKYLMVKGSQCDDLVSVIMPSYNRANIIMTAVDSVLNQTYENFELIIVDDGSRDKTREILESIDDERVKPIFSKTNGGASAARNIGLENASGKYIFYLDSDNSWDEKYLQTMMGAFLELEDADAIYSAQLLYEGLDNAPFAMRFGALNKSLLKNGNYIDLNCFAHSKKVYDELGGFDESLYRLNDWDLILRISNSFKVYSVPVLLSNYYLSITDNSISDANARSNEKMLGYRNLTESIQYMNNPEKTIDYELERKVSIVIPSFESLKDLNECLNAILAFDNRMVKIIIVDNDSGSAVRYYLECLRNDGLIELIQNDVNYGFTYAVNQGIEISDEDSDILLLNNDAILMKGSIEAMQKAAYEIKDCGIVVPQQVLPGGTPTMRIHVPYASEGFDCDVNPSAHHKNIVNMRNFHDGEYLELSFAPFFCTYIKRDTLKMTFGLDAELGRHYRSDRIFSEYVRHVLNLKIYHVSDAVVYHKLQKATQTLRKNEDALDLMLFKNRWEEDLAEELGYKQANWDTD